MSKIFHIVQTSLTGRGLRNWDQEWFKFRIGLFKQYTISSLLNQSAKNFTHWITMRPAEESNPLAQDFVEYLNGVDYSHVVSFTGQPYLYRKCNNRDFKERLETGLAAIKPFYNGEDYVYLTVIDSDDLYHKDAIAEIQSHPFKDKGALYFRQGYLLNMLTMQLGRYTGGMRCPPFWTIQYPADVFFDVEKYIEYGLTVVHHDIPLKFDATKLTDFRYAMGVHKTNYATRWNDPAQIDEITDDKIKKDILKDFNVKV